MVSKLICDQINKTILEQVFFFLSAFSLDCLACGRAGTLMI